MRHDQPAALEEDVRRVRTSICELRRPPLRGAGNVA